MIFDLLKDRREHFLKEAKLMQEKMNKSRPAERDRVMALNLKVICSEILDYNIDPRVIVKKLDLARRSLRRLRDSEAEIFSHEEIESEQVAVLYAALDTLSVRCAKGISGAWQEVLWMCVNLSLIGSVKKWAPSKLTRDWVLKVLNSPSMCTEQAQACYLLNFVLMWPDDLLTPKKIGRQLMEGCVASGQNIRIYRGVVEGYKRSIGSVTKHVLRLLREKDHLDLFCEKLLVQLREHRMGLELRWTTNLIQYMLAHINLRVESHVVYNDWAMKIIYVAKLFEEMVMCDAFRLFLFAPGVKTATALILFEMIRSTVTCVCNGSPKYNFVYREAFEWMNVLYDHVGDPLLIEVSRRHSYELQKLSDMLSSKKSPRWATLPAQLLNKPDEGDDINCPEEFIDILTMDLMQMPIRLPTCENVMDEGTFYRLLLTEKEPRDPYTQLPLMNEKGSFAYTKLPRLARRIKRWRKKPYQKNDSTLY
ncbi:uncharacterized protein LOC143031171 [Oratosquilla oratoria]|uniref:uncharacterized protein LOC143031171 n=1 Tax=Oratosquilla oratoria TaxID=337810 RepID=UPI003F75D7DE